MSKLCYECGGLVDVLSEPHRLMDVRHEKENLHRMQVCAHERCIISSPNERHWQYAARHAVTTKEELAAMSEAIMDLANCEGGEV